MATMKTLKFPGSNNVYEMVDATARAGVASLQTGVASLQTTVGGLEDDIAAAGGELTDIRSALNDSAINGCFSLSNFELGVFHSGEGVISSSKTWVAGGVPVKQGDKIYVNPGSLYINVVITSSNSVLHHLFGSYATFSKPTARTVEAPSDGLLYVNTRNAPKGADSTAITRADIDVVVKAYTTLVSKVKDTVDANYDELTQKIENIDTTQLIEMEDGYIANNQSTVDITDVTISGTWKHAVVSCSEGDRFTLNSNSTTIPRAWSFIKSDGTVISAAAANTTYSNEALIAPSNSAYLVINTNVQSNYEANFIGFTVPKNIDLLWKEVGVWEFEQNEAAVINKVMADKDANTLTFAVITDAHYDTTLPRALSINQTKLFARVCAKVNAKFGVHLGDIIEGGEATLAANKELIGEYWASMNQIEQPMLYTIAHHEMYGIEGASGWGSDPTACTPSECVGMYGFGEKWLDIVYDTDKTSWYADVDGIRFIGLNSVSDTTRGFSNDVISFLSDALTGTSLPVIVFAHCPSAATVNWNNGSVQNNDAVNTLLNGYASDVFAYIHGHTHWDNIYKFPTFKYPFISVCCSLPIKMDVETYGCTNGTPVAHDRVVGAWSEYCFDVVNIHKDTGTIKLFRYGAGTDRTFSPN